MSEEAEIESKVRSHFGVKDYFVREAGSVEYKVKYDERSKRGFLELYKFLKPKGYTPRLYGTKEDTTLLVSKEPEIPQKIAYAPLFLFFLSLLTIIVVGWLLASFSAPAFPSQPVILTTISFVLGVMAILGFHEMAHIYMSRRSGDRISMPYYIPNIPIFSALPLLAFLPTFGSITFTRDAARSKDDLFNIYFIGPIIGITVALVVSVIGAVTSEVVSQPDFLAIFGQSAKNIIYVNDSLLQNLMREVATSLGVAPRVPSGYLYIPSLVDSAASIGFLVSFFSLLPAALFDGGRMSSLVLGDRGSKLVTAATAFLLLLVDVPNYWVVVLLVVLLAARPPSMETLDSLTDVSSTKKLLLVVAIALAFVSAPIPQNFATFPLIFR